jgi:hypothetical protein
MATRKVRLLPHQVAPATRRFARDLVEGCVRGMRETAMFGVTAVQKTANRTKPRPRATGQYDQAWAWQTTKHGAVLGHPSKQAYFVEAGRKPGKKPPRDAILEWIRIKRIFRNKRGDLKKHLRKPKVAKPGFEKPGHKGKARAVYLDKQTGKVRRGEAASRLYRRDAMETELAMIIQAKIGRVGTKPRWVLRRTMPAIVTRSKRESMLAVRAAIARVHP